MCLKSGLWQCLGFLSLSLQTLCRPGVFGHLISQILCHANHISSYEVKYCVILYFKSNVGSRLSYCYIWSQILCHTNYIYSSQVNPRIVKTHLYTELSDNIISINTIRMIIIINITIMIMIMIIIIIIIIIIKKNFWLWSLNTMKWRQRQQKKLWWWWSWWWSWWWPWRSSKMPVTFEPGLKRLKFETGYFILLLHGGHFGISRMSGV